jgi:S1-C subfamily serine protease
VKGIANIIPTIFIALLITQSSCSDNPVTNVLAKYLEKKLGVDSESTRSDAANIVSSQKTELFNKIAPAIATVIASDDSGNPFAYGSGIFISSNGKLLTNFHVIDGSKNIVVKTNDNKILEVKNVTASSKVLDYVVLETNAYSTSIPYVPIGNSEFLQVGQNIYTISSPELPVLKNTFTSGEISGIRARDTLPTGQDVDGILGHNMIQFTAPVAQGSSGGALLDESGELVGLISSKLVTTENIAFAIPIDEIKPTFNSLSAISIEQFRNSTAISNSMSPTTPTQYSNPIPYGSVTDYSYTYSFKECVQLGNQDFRNGNYSDAIKYWIVALKQRPGSIPIINKVAYAFNAMGDKDTAEAIYWYAFGLDTTNYMTVFNMAEFYGEMGSQICGQYNCSEVSQKLYAATLELNPPLKIAKQVSERLYGYNTYQRKVADSSFILPNSDKIRLSASEVSKLSPRQLALARNEIFARHGYVYTEKPKSKIYKDYFESKNWYRQNPYYDGSISEIEKYNVELIKYYEAKNSSTSEVMDRLGILEE